MLDAGKKKERILKKKKKQKMEEEINRVAAREHSRLIDHPGPVVYFILPMWKCTTDKLQIISIKCNFGTEER